ncbi:MAG: quinone-dependent dihydroorotate dehydrogenase [Rhodospirillales bacterium]|nr:quinone-dependent dihydroorotate dehydrogenase [Rhodospirillales bacterium]
MDAETKHIWTLRALNAGLTGKTVRYDRDELAMLRQEICGIQFMNPLGLAAGFDKYARAVPAYERIGLGFAELGSVTPLPQPGNPRPRMHKLWADQAMINHMGLNNPGYTEFFKSIENARPQLKNLPIIVNLAKGKDQTDPAADYVNGLKTCAGRADMVVLNLSCPNVTNFKNLQDPDQATPILEAIATARHKNDITEPVFVKIGPDLKDDHLQTLITLCMQTCINGIVATNLTHHRPANLKTKNLPEHGGLSGPPLRDQSTQVIGKIYQMSNGRLPVIGVGGISNAQDAYDKIRAGASLLELYTAIAYKGFEVVPEIVVGLANLLKNDSFTHISAAIGADHKAVERLAS